jgi:FMN-dependent oxidoreductase (nitrilotriacetate monooxygenase family)
MREIRLLAFDMAAPGHIQQGMWTHKRDRARYADIDYWTDIARLLERGLFDGIFLADVLGVYDVYESRADAALKGGVQIPLLDPMLLVPAMAAATTHLGFGITCNTAYEPPYLFARRMSTLDHLTRGRIGWNIVTGYLDSAARAMGFDAQMRHDDRYDLADEYVRLARALWETSWEDGAVLRDAAARLFTDPSKVHRVRHEGGQFAMDAIHLCEPSPQRTPVLFQAGASGRGRQFAAEHAECVFVNGTSRAQVRALADDLRARAAPRRIMVFAGATVVTGATTADAQDKLADYAAHADGEGALAHASASLGIDFSRYGLDEPIEAALEASQAIRSNIEALAKSVTGPITRRKLLEHCVLGSRQAPLVGSAGDIADTLQAWMEDTGIDGFNLSRTVMPECLEDFIRLVIPVLQDRGLYKTAYAGGTFRQKLFGGDGGLATAGV